ncbi:MAG: hypothetical protein IPQ08_00065 [Chitinophagaceae bacterium]|nr:hypothetical protein [Chitinophagaceae bacterium]
MEVHAHSHTARKKWTHYLWEFLMLFLAVFCGFLAENMREHQVEKERGRQYVLSFCEDLRTDTAQFRLLIAELNDKSQALKTAIPCIDSFVNGSGSGYCLDDVVVHTLGFTDFIYTDRTIQQLKYAGGLRLIQDKSIVDTIIKYDAMVRQEMIHQEVLENQQQIAQNAHNAMLGYTQLLRLRYNQRSIGNKLTLITTDKSALNKYFNEISSFGMGCNGQLRWMISLKDQASRALEFLKQKGY